MSSLVRQPTESSTPKVQATAALIGDTCVTINKCCFEFRCTLSRNDFTRAPNVSNDSPLGGVNDGLFFHSLHVSFEIVSK